MPIQVPSIQRTGPVAPTSVGRIETSAPNINAAVAPQTEAIGNAISTGAKIVDAMEEQAASVESTAASNEYNAWYRTKAASLKQLEGEPTKAYQDFDREAQEYEKTILAKYEGASALTKSAVSKAILIKKSALYDDRMVNEATQAHTYESKVRSVAIETEKNGILDAGKLFDPALPNAYARLDGHLTEIDKQFLEGGKARGMVAFNEEKGVYDIDPILRNEMKKAKSEGLSNLIKSLSAGGDLAKAQAVREKYADQIIGIDKAKIAQTNKASQANFEAASIAEDLFGLSGDELEAALDQKTEDPVVKEKARNKIVARERQTDYRKGQRSKQVYESLMDTILDKRDKGLPISWDEIESSQEYIQQSGNMTSKHREALRQTVELPKTSDPKKLEAAMDTLTDPETDLKNMSASQFQEVVEGVSGKDRGFLTRLWTDARTETSVEKRILVNSNLRNVPKAMLAAGLVKHNKWGKFSDKDQNKIYEYQQELDRLMVTMPPNTPRDKVQDELNRFIATKAKGEVFKWEQPTKKKIEGGREPLTKPSPEATSRKLTPAELNEAMTMWKAANGGKYDAKRGDTALKVKDFWMKNRKAQ